ncbi:uncharacterized protein LOC135936398 [Cloeon dipterum]|uniref:uncharacterized protein LOC135936398 n=1 Tax=Cloeon dipterum TaxID=197152 RepID=UPI00322070DB
MQLIAFSLKRKTTWRVKIANVQFEALAISRFEDRKFLYISGYNTSGLYAVDLSVIRKGNVNPAITLVGNKMAPSRRMVFDGINEMIYFDLPKTGSVGTLDLITFKEELVFKDAGFGNYWPFLLAFDYPKTLFMMVGDTIGDKKKYRLFKAVVEAKSLSFRDRIMMTGRVENESDFNTPNVSKTK